MRVRLTEPDLLNPVGSQLASLLSEIVADGKIDLDEIKKLRHFLREHKDCDTIVAIRYLHDIMVRITADKIVDRNEVRELGHAIYSVIPKQLVIKQEQVDESVLIDVTDEQSDRELYDESPISQLYDLPTEAQLRYANKLGINIHPELSKRSLSQEISKFTGERTYLKHDWGEYLGECPTVHAQAICQALSKRYRTVNFVPTNNGATSAIGYRRIDGDEMSFAQIDRIDDGFDEIVKKILSGTPKRKSQNIRRRRKSSGCLIVAIILIAPLLIYLIRI